MQRRRRRSASVVRVMEKIAERAGGGVPMAADVVGEGDGVTMLLERRGLTEGLQWLSKVRLIRECIAQCLGDMTCAQRLMPFWVWSICGVVVRFSSLMYCIELIGSLLSLCHHRHCSALCRLNYELDRLPEAYKYANPPVYHKSRPRASEYLRKAYPPPPPLPIPLALILW